MTDASLFPDDLTVHLAEIVHASNAAITSVTMDRRIRSWNPGAEALFGFTVDEALGADLMILVPPDRMEEALGFYSRVRGGEIFSVETIRRHKSGRLIEVAMSLAPIRNPAGEIVGTCAVTHDISAQKATEQRLREEALNRQRTEEALRASERDFRKFFEMADVGNVIADARTYRFLRVNRRFCELTGYSAEELTALTSESLTDPADVEQDRAGWQEALRQDAASFTIEKRYRRKDGSTIWVHVTSTLVRSADGEPLHAVGVVRDVTDRRQAVEELERTRRDLEERVKQRTAELAAASVVARESAHRLETLIANSPLAIIALDLLGRVELWNPASERLFGWSAAEVLGQFVPHLPRDHTSHYLAELRTMLSSPDCSHSETQRERRDGTLIDVAIWRAPLLGADRAVTGSMAILMDVSERKFLERALLEATERESRRIGQELHDHLCQHLLGAAFSAKAVAIGLPPESTVAEELSELARSINSAVQQARDIARGLNPVEMDSAGLMAALEELATRPHMGKSCRLECPRPVLLLDPEASLHAYRIAQEAVYNAVQHSDGTEIVMRLTEDEHHVHLTISDDGSHPLKPAQTNPGLGFAIMKYRAQAIAGKITIDTTAAGSVCVHCSFPRKR